MSPLFAPGNGYRYDRGTERSFTGTHSLKITDTLRTASVAVQSDPIPIIPGEEYTAGMNLYIESGQPGFMFRFFDAITRPSPPWKPIWMNRDWHNGRK